MALADQIGSLETGKQADVIVVSLDRLHTAPASRDLVSSLVYSAQSSDVQSVLVDGEILMENQELLTLDERSVLDEAAHEGAELVKRANLTN